MTVSMRKIAKQIADSKGLKHREVEATLWEAFDIIAKSLAAGEKVIISNFGTFDTHMRSATKAWNLGTQEPMGVPSHRVARFKVTGRLKAMVRNSDAAVSIRKIRNGRHVRATTD